MPDATPASAPAPASSYDAAAARLAAFGRGMFYERDYPATGTGRAFRSAQLVVARATYSTACELLDLACTLPPETRPYLTVSGYGPGGDHYATLAVSRDLTPDEIAALAEVEAERAAS
jgi:hypothetical protein